MPTRDRMVRRHRIGPTPTHTTAAGHGHATAQHSGVNAFQPDIGGEPRPDAILDDVWAALARGKADRKHAYHQPVIATTDAEGRPDARTVVLRFVDRATSTLGFHTDARSPKLDHLRLAPTLAWHFYDPGAKTQLRIRAEASIHTDDPIADEAWAATRLFSRRCYLAPRPPSLPAARPSPNLPEDLLETDPDHDRSEAGRANFAVVRARILEIDWLWLRRGGHLRARFTGGPDADPGFTWLEP